MDRYWYFRERRFFRGDVASREALFIARSTRVALRRGDMAFFEGDPGDSCYYVESGLMRLFSVTDAGRDPVLFLRGPGEMLGMAEAINRYPRRASAQALVPTVLHHLSSQDLESLLEHDYPLARRVITLLGGRFRFLNESAFSAPSPLDRLVNLLISLVYDQLEDGHWERPACVPFPLPDDMAASITGLPLASIATLMASLRAAGLIRLEGGHICLPNPAHLVSRAGG